MKKMNLVCAAIFALAFSLNAMSAEKVLASPPKIENLSIQEQKQIISSKINMSQMKSLVKQYKSAKTDIEKKSLLLNLEQIGAAGTGEPASYYGICADHIHFCCTGFWTKVMCGMLNDMVDDR